MGGGTGADGHSQELVGVITGADREKKAVE